MPSIVHMTSAHPPFDTRIFRKECRSLSQTYSVTLIAPHPQDELNDGVQIRAVDKAKNRLERMTSTIWKVYQACLKEPADLYHFHDPELMPVAILLRLSGKKVIFDVHENLPAQIASKYWIPQLLRAPVAQGADWLERLSGWALSGVVAATPSIALRFPEGKTVSVQNFPSLSELGMETPAPYPQRPHWVGYIGGISQIRGIVEITQAMAYLSGVRLKLAGSFSPAGLEAEVQQLEGWHNTDYLGWQSREQIGTLLQQLRVGLVTLHPVPNYVDSYPVKMFEYMAAGIPVVASNFPFWRSIVEEARCGLLVDPMNPAEIAQAIQYLLDHPQEAQQMGENGRKAVLEKYNWEAEEKKLLELYTRII